MPTLPTFNVTAAQAQRIMAALGDNGDGAAYKAWLKRKLKDAVFVHEADEISVQADRDIASKRADVEAVIGGMS